MSVPKTVASTRRVVRSPLLDQRMSLALRLAGFSGDGPSLTIGSMTSNVPEMRVEKVVSGGQTGADRAALDVAIELGIPHGGWCPQGRRAEDGPIAARYLLQETKSADHAVRTQWNVIESDATLILYLGPISGGTELTRKLARRHSRPCLLVDLEDPLDAAEVRHWLTDHRVRVLNVAGPRESTCPGIGNCTEQFLRQVFAD